MPVLMVKNWSRFQHYKDRCPPWIKLQTDTFRNYDFSRLQDASKLLAVCILTLASCSEDPKLGSVPDDFEYIKRQCSLGSWIKKENLEELVSCGFLRRVADCKQDASNMLASCKQSAIPETETETETESPPTPPAGGSVVSIRSDGFEEFWKAYPRKVGKHAGMKAWRKVSGESMAIMLGLSRWVKCDQWRRDGGQYVPYPATFLNQRRWEEDPYVRAAAALDIHYAEVPE